MLIIIYTQQASGMVATNRMDISMLSVGTVRRNDVQLTSALVSAMTSTGFSSGTTNDVFYIKHSVAFAGLNK